MLRGHMELNQETQIALAALIADRRSQVLRSALGEDAELYLVGGTLRDVLLKQSAGDFDYACNLTPAELAQRFDRADIRHIPTGLKHQTITVIPVTELPAVEITTFRSAAMTPYSGPVFGTSIAEDVSYRDFTVNALALDVRTGTLLDSQGGADDITDRIIRAVGEPAQRFTEDPLRVMRMVRLGLLAGFTIDGSTLLAAHNFINQLCQVSIERIRDEFSKILLSPRADEGLRILQTLGFFQRLLPEVAAFVDFEQNAFHKADLFNHTLEVVRGTPEDLVTRLAALFHDVGKPPTLSIDPLSGDRHFYLHEAVGAEMTREILTRMRYPNAITDDVTTLVRLHMRPINAGSGGLRRIIRDTGNTFPKWRALKFADAMATRLNPMIIAHELASFDQAIEEIRKGPEVSPLKNLAINGGDLLATGIKEGPIVGRILRTLHEQVLDQPELNERATLLQMVPGIVKKLGG